MRAECASWCGISFVREGYEVLEAGDGEEALDLFYREKDIALIILDVMMPKRNGFEVCREIRETSKVPIIMLTAKGEESDELNGFELGVDEYISKPFFSEDTGCACRSHSAPERKDAG